MRIAYFATIKMIGNSHCVIIPKHIRTIIEAKRGDFVRIEIEKVEIDDNLHDDTSARSDPQTRDKGIHQEE